MNGQKLDIGFVKYFMAKSVGTLNPKTPITVRADDKIDTALNILKQYSIGCVLVINETGKLVGIFTERDALKKDKVFMNREILVEEVMTISPHAESPTTSVAHVMFLMSKAGYRHVPLVDDAGRPIGLISVRDILEHFSDSLDRYFEDVTAMAKQVIAERALKDKASGYKKPPIN